MAPSYAVEVAGDNARVTLSGKLDAVSAPQLAEELKKLVGTKIAKVVFFAEGLEYLSSAGLRVIVFAKQKIGPATEVIFVRAQQGVKDVISMTGFDGFVTFADSFPA
jgi:anti-anti-sigma factor